MTLRMGDGPVANIPAGLDAVAGYVNKSGIGITYPAVVAAFPTLHHLSITTDGSPAMCADVESGAMSSWAGYDYGYCSVSMVNELVARYGRPRRLWTAHYDPRIGPHICSPACTPGLVTTADGTQWTDHGGWDESLLHDDFFSTPTPHAGTTVLEDTMPTIYPPNTGEPALASEVAIPVPPGKSGTVWLACDFQPQSVRCFVGVAGAMRPYGGAASGLVGVPVGRKVGIPFGAADEMVSLVHLGPNLNPGQPHPVTTLTVVN